MPKNIPFLSTWAMSRGWPFLLAWGHRIAGLSLVAFMGFHIATLSALHEPSLYEAKMKALEAPVFQILEWALAVPVILHALNGGRLILYESFGVRKDEWMIRWVLGLSVAYLAILGVIMGLGDQTVSTAFFWLPVFVAGVFLTYGVAARIGKTSHGLSWRIQRITGAFLLVLVPAHLLFMHLNPSMGHSADVVRLRMMSPWIKALDSILILAVLYHGGFGLISVIRDYIPSRPLRVGMTGAVLLGMAVLAFIGIRILLTV